MTTALRRRDEAALLVASTIGAIAILRLVDTQIYNEPWAIDPWLYTALMTNFDTIYGWFSTTYYASRLPAILPGLFLNSFLTPQHAYVVLHVVMFLAGGVFVYMLVRTVFDVTTAIFLYPVVLTNAAFVDAHTWDYVDGFVITYLAGGLYFLASSMGSRHPMRLALAGLFLAAAIATNLFATLLVVGALAAYAYGRACVGGLAYRDLAGDGACLVAGAAVLLAGCAAFAREHGGPTFFLRPSIDAARSISSTPWKLPTYSWVWAEPRLLVVPAVGAVVILAWPHRRRTAHDPLALALTVATVALFLVLAYWEVARSGIFLQLEYYFDMLYPFVFVALAAALVALVGSTARSLPPHAAAGLGLAVGGVPLVAVYGFGAADLWGRRGTVVAGVLLGGAVVVAAFLRLAGTRRLGVAAAPLAAVVLALGVNYASAASATTRGTFETTGSSLADAEDVFSIGVQLMDFMQQHGLEESRPSFWFNGSEDPAYTGIQSLYFSIFMYLNTVMPRVDERFRSLMASREPRHVVLLCAERTCRRGPDAMRRAGYRLDHVATARLSSGRKSVWVDAYAVR